MPTTKIADVIVPEIFNPYVINRVTDKSALVRSGIIATNPELDALASAGGKIIHMPHWNDLGGESQVLSDTVPLNVDKITTGQDQARLHMRGNAWGANDLAGALAGSDPMKAIGELVSDFWVRDEQRILIASLKGVFSAANMTGNIYDPSAATDGSELFSSKGFLTAQFKLGDAYDALTAIAVHSMTYAAMLEKDMIEFIPDSQGKPIAKYRGLDIVVDDNMPVVGGVYTSYLFGRGAFGYANGSPKVPTETDRDSLQGEDYLINRRHFVLHPRGVKWNEASVAGVSPTNIEIATAANWTRVFDPKKIRVVQYKHKLG